MVLAKILGFAHGSPNSSRKAYVVSFHAPGAFGSVPHHRPLGATGGFRVDTYVRRVARHWLRRRTFPVRLQALGGRAKATFGESLFWSMFFDGAVKTPADRGRGTEIGRRILETFSVRTIQRRPDGVSQRRYWANWPSNSLGEPRRFLLKMN